ncbi:MAG: hypothetical protein IJ106_11020 [Parasporobacterium sp.]|nr:hypothetical protein [Parasporobacterium sp.]
MKVILSRKGFDSTNGGCPSPILPDGTLLSLPIPSKDEDTYSNISYQGKSYSEILRQLRPKKEYSHCHVDPDLRPNLRNRQVKGWMPAFGQIDAAQGLLSNAGVGPGDIFLFFGWFRKVIDGTNGYRFAKRGYGDYYSWADMHVIYGYMQIGRILLDPDEIKNYTWHPHASASRLQNKTNALYLPADHLSWNPSMKGWGTLGFRKDRVLTMKGMKRGTWNPFPFLLPEHVYGNKKNSATNGGLYYGGIWQELVIYDSEGLIEWVNKLLQ